jgi:hypothetical protein
LVVGSGGGASSFLFILFMLRITRKRTNAMIIKFIRVLTNTPQLITTAPAPLAASSVTYGPAVAPRA